MCMNTRALQNVRGVVQITADINESDVVNLEVVMSTPLSTATLRMSYSIYLETEYKSA
jgi:hypothetical protein